ncbi:alpha/beta fold hydrolase [Pseudomonas sp. NPDC007930]|uniref:alpha/beta fold hydrolase n=1 Tax=Pseudomonas sp. NPDC007930 TaxID=3364417 RepID=UPI0036E14A75
MPLYRLALLPLLITGANASAAALPSTQGDWVIPSFTFHSGETLANLNMHYVTVGDPKNPAVLYLHGTNRPGSDVLKPEFAGVLFGPGQPLDASRYYIIAPDGIGVGQSSKPSDGLRAQYPAYNYSDLVNAQYRLLTEGLKVKHLRLVIGNSMGGMQTWLWGTEYPAMMDGLVPMASQPSEMASRNWVMRRLLIEAIKQDPAWNNGNYTTQPPSLRLANALFSAGTSGGDLGWYAQAPTHALAEQQAQARLAQPLADDANDFIYQWQASADYNPAPRLGNIQAPLLAINSADDERNPPQTGTLEAALKALPNARLLLIPESEATRGHGTTGYAKFYAEPLRAFVEGLPARR